MEMGYGVLLRPTPYQSYLLGAQDDTDAMRVRDYILVNPHASAQSVRIIDPGLVSREETRGSLEQGKPMPLEDSLRRLGETREQLILRLSDK